MSETETVDTVTAQRRAFRADLEEHGWLVPSPAAMLPASGRVR